MLDFDVLYNYLDNDQEVIYAVLSTYQEDHANSLEEIEQLLADQDWTKLHAVVHTLKGILASFGEEVATPHLEQIERATLANQAPEQANITPMFQEVAAINQQIEEALNAF